MTFIEMQGKRSVEVLLKDGETELKLFTIE